MEAKKKRGCNYTAAELDVLLDLIKKYKHIIDNKETKGHMILKKRETWEFVCQQYNAVAVSGFRKWHQLRHLYENIKQRSKIKNITRINNENDCTGSRADKSAMTEQDAQILVMVTPKIEPVPNPYDDPALHFGHVEVNNDETSEISIINTDKTGVIYIYIFLLLGSIVIFIWIHERDTTATDQECNKPQSSTPEISNEIIGN